MSYFVAQFPICLLHGVDFLGIGRSNLTSLCNSPSQNNTIPDREEQNQSHNCWLVIDCGSIRFVDQYDHHSDRLQGKRKKGKNWICLSCIFFSPVFRFNRYYAKSDDTHPFYFFRSSTSQARNKVATNGNKMTHVIARWTKVTQWSIGDLAMPHRTDWRNGTFVVDALMGVVAVVVVGHRRVGMWLH